MMLKQPIGNIRSFESQFPGITKEVLRFEHALFPACAKCGSKDTALVRGGFSGFGLCLACSTTKVKLNAENSEKGNFYCNKCGEFFTLRVWNSPIWRDDLNDVEKLG